MKHVRHEDRPGDVLERARLLRHVLPAPLSSGCESRAPARIVCGRSSDHAGLLLATPQRKLLFPDPISDACGSARLYVIGLSEEGRLLVNTFYLISASKLNRHMPRVRQYQGRWQTGRHARAKAVFWACFAFS
ncbi:hypothetical protein KVR01_003759 [Diaporthe batatas]|uniref:uncharacterized protein n=1 Tax=Diaporthe batatas TaxID=748121 RepID=UPI001D05BBEA|nr:uncharacterized protein KVR01_003759 [Diaporthe batatas]KAG8168070.1 hypothetical protein KVR01_003759 [Diaporthe batatas]